MMNKKIVIMKKSFYYKKKFQDYRKNIKNNN